MGITVVDTHADHASGTSITNIQCTTFGGCAPIAVGVHLKPCVHLGLHCQMCLLSVSIHDLSPEKGLI